MSERLINESLKWFGRLTRAEKKKYTRRCLRVRDKPTELITVGNIYTIYTKFYDIIP